MCREAERSWLRSLPDTNRRIDLNEEGIQQAEEASTIFEQLGDAVEQARCLISQLTTLILFTTITPTVMYDMGMDRSNIIN